jgi:hypothetical protein
MNPHAVTYETRETDREDWMSGAPISAVFRVEDGVAVSELGSDGGEPEDNSLSRDWSWVAPALQAAYDLGREHGA